MTPSPPHLAMNCVQLVELVTEWMDDALPPARRQELEEHLAICPGCVAYVSQARGTVRALRQVDDLPPEPVPAPLRDQLLAAFRSWRVQRGTT